MTLSSQTITETLGNGVSKMFGRLPSVNGAITEKPDGITNGVNNPVKSDESIEEIVGPGVDEAYIHRCIQEAAPNALRMALYQVTADPELATMKISKQPIRGGALYDYVNSDEDVAIIREKALQYLTSKRRPPVPPVPSYQETHKLMNLFGGRMIAENDVLPGWEELCFADFPRGVEWSKKPAPERIASWKVVVIGAGLSGIATAVQLKRLGIPYVVIERQSDLGGTWLLNTYPECRVDTLSYLFQYKFEKNYKWKDYFAAREQTCEYLHHIAKKYGIEDDFQYDREVFASMWDEASSTWKIEVENKLTGEVEKLTANSIISASGLFATANDLPDIPGIRDFKGPMFHTAKWDHSVNYAGKRVASIGTGSTGTQLAPAVAEKASHMAIYQRTPNWIASYEGYHESVTPQMNWICDNMPYYWNWYCFAAYYRSLDLAPLQVTDRDFEAKGGRVNARNEMMRESLTDFIHKRMADRPDLITKLVPKTAPLVRRLVVDNGFYDTLKRDNVELVTDGIDSITETGIRTKDGQHRQYDIIVLGAGFKVSKYFFPIDYDGRGGRTLDENFAKDGARSYLGMVMPGFPNLFTLYGPNHQPRGGSLYSWAEIWARYAVASVVWMLENNAKSMDVKQDVFDEYQKKLDAETATLIWESEGAGYYVNEHGRQGVNMPWTTSNYHAMVIKPNIDDFDIS